MNSSLRKMMFCGILENTRNYLSALGTTFTHTFIDVRSSWHNVMIPRGFIRAHNC